MALTVRRIHYDGPLRVEAVGLPAAIQMAPFWLGAKQSTVPVVLTATDPAATSSDADWGAAEFPNLQLPDGSTISDAELQLAPPAPKKLDTDIFRSARLRTDLFTAVRPVAQFSLTADPAAVTVAPGAAATVTIRSTRAAEWTMPIEIASGDTCRSIATWHHCDCADQWRPANLPSRLPRRQMPSLVRLAVFLQGKAKKDKVEPVHPVPAIVVEVKAP